jgi:hypothetical protein
MPKKNPDKFLLIKEKKIQREAKQMISVVNNGKI